MLQGILLIAFPEISARENKFISIIVVIIPTLCVCIWRFACIERVMLQILTCLEKVGYDEIHCLIDRLLYWDVLSIFCGIRYAFVIAIHGRRRSKEAHQFEMQEASQTEPLTKA